MDKPLTQLRRFFELAAERKLCGNDQLLYLHLWNAFNSARYPESVKLTDAELLRRMNQHESSGKPLGSLKNPKARLKKKRFIDFTPGKGDNPTEYRLLPLCDEEPAPLQASEVLQVWNDCGGVTPNTFIAQELLKRAETLGANFVAAAIRDARKACQYPRMNYLFFESFLEGRLNRKGGGKNERTGNGTEQYAGLLDTDVPAEYAVR